MQDGDAHQKRRADADRKLQEMTHRGLTRMAAERPFEMHEVVEHHASRQTQDSRRNVGEAGPDDQSRGQCNVDDQSGQSDREKA